MLTWILESGCLEAEVSQIRLWDQTGEGGAVVQVHVTANEGDLAADEHVVSSLHLDSGHSVMAIFTLSVLSLHCC